MSITVKPKISLNFSEGFAGKEGSVTKNTCPDIMQHDDASWAIPKSLRRGTLQPSSTGQKAQPAPRRPGERPFDLCFLWYPISGQTHTVCELLTFYSVVGFIGWMIHKDVPKFHMCCNCCRKLFNNPRCRDPHQHLPANRLQRSLPINIYIYVCVYILHVITCACNSTLKYDNTWYIYIHICRINDAINLLISQTGAWFVSDLGYPQHVTNSAKETAPSLPSACGASEAGTVGGFSLVNDQLWGMSPNIMWFLTWKRLRV